MALPASPLPTSTVGINGTDVEIRSLSRAEALKLNAYQGREDEAENYILACATGVTEDEATEWRGSVDVATAGSLIDAILVLSGLATIGDDGIPKLVPSSGRSRGR